MKKCLLVVALTVILKAPLVFSAIPDRAQACIANILEKIDGKSVKDENELLFTELKQKLSMNQAIPLKTMGILAKMQTNNSYIWGCLPGIISRVYINQEKFNLLPVTAKQFVLAHELMRIKYKHDVQIFGIKYLLQLLSRPLRNKYVPQRYKENLVKLFLVIHFKPLVNSYYNIKSTFSTLENDLVINVNVAPESDLKVDLQKAVRRVKRNRAEPTYNIKSIAQAFVGTIIDKTLALPVAFYARSLEREADKAAIEVLGTKAGADAYLQEVQKQKASSAQSSLFIKSVNLFFTGINNPLQLVPGLASIISSKNNPDQRKAAIQEITLT
ncbi:hypothetical protein H0X48_03680 [Candidatus Dependentiae bacterium]|nr:hypothetical protein [Candidatus Dependentiae bacterium]